MTNQLDTYRLPRSTNYIGVFLTFACPLDCSYCINRHSSFKWQKPMTGSDWIRGLNRLKSRPDLPVTLQGGEPTAHRGFYKIVNGLDPKLNIDVLTNGFFDIDKFTRNVSPSRLKRDAKYASIRFSYHPGVMTENELMHHVLILKTLGYSVGIWAVNHPAYEYSIKSALRTAKDVGIDFRLKEFLGRDEGGNLHGTYRYPEAVCASTRKSCVCRTHDLLIGPSGNIFKCHSDLYAARNPIGHILDDEMPKQWCWRYCEHYGDCNPCDVKTKFNRFQEEGHCSVDIKKVRVASND